MMTPPSCLLVDEGRLDGCAKAWNSRLFSVIEVER